MALFRPLNCTIYKDFPKTFYTGLKFWFYNILRNFCVSPVRWNKIFLTKNQAPNYLSSDFNQVLYWGVLLPNPRDQQVQHDIGPTMKRAFI